MILYRPVGLKEMELIAKGGFRGFPPRLAGQPIFYPVLNEEYARQIARDWNTRDAASGFAGFVTRFVVDDAFADRYEEHIVGRRDVHRELWVPAGELEEFNRQIVGRIEVMAAYYGQAFAGEIDPKTSLPRSIVTDAMRGVQHE